MNKSLLSLEELAEAVAAELQQMNLLAQDRRVSAQPDARTLRYYTSLGLLDPPTIVQRQARYHQRHFLQATAVKALQAAGYSLAQIQQHLFGLDQSQLQQLLQGLKQSPARSFQPLHWLEIPLEPGCSLKLSPDWKPRNTEALLQTFAELLKSLSENTDHPHKEHSSHDHPSATTE